jgi:predicted dehydrogenase
VEELLRREGFRLEALCQEGLDGEEIDPGGLPCHPDYNVLLRDRRVELVLVGGPLELRRDFAVRALNAGRHVVVQEPFCETALGAERVMKTAFHGGLVATMNMTWRDEPDLRALRMALTEENVGPVHGVQAFWQPVRQQEDAPPGGVLLDEAGMAVLDSLNVLARRDVRDVSAHLLRPAPQRPERGFFLYLPLRGGGYAAAHAGPHRIEGLPSWLASTRGATFRAAEGCATVVADGEQRVYRAPEGPEDFWQNLHEAVRSGAELKCHPLDIVRAMKLHEAALESARTGRPVTV